MDRQWTVWAGKGIKSSLYSFNLLEHMNIISCYLEYKNIKPCFKKALQGHVTLALPVEDGSSSREWLWACKFPENGANLEFLPLDITKAVAPSPEQYSPFRGTILCLAQPTGLLGRLPRPQRPRSSSSQVLHLWGCTCLRHSPPQTWQPLSPSQGLESISQHLWWRQPRRVPAGWKNMQYFLPFHLLNSSRKPILTTDLIKSLVLLHYIYWLWNKREIWNRRIFTILPPAFISCLLRLWPLTVLPHQ